MTQEHICFVLRYNLYSTSSISLGGQDLVKKGSSGLYGRRIVNQPLLGSV